MIKMKLVKTKQITNIKPEAWYDEYYASLDDYFIESKEEDKRLDVYYIIDKYLAPLREQIQEAMLIMDPLYRKYDELPLQERNDKLMSIKEFVAAKNQFDKAYKKEYHEPPPGVSESEFSRYHQVIRGKIDCNLEIVFNYNTLEKNVKFLGFLVAKHNNLKKKRGCKQMFSLTSCNGVYKGLENLFKLCQQAIREGYLITHQLDELHYEIGECYYDFLNEKEQRQPQTPFDIIFTNFFYSDEQIFNLIRKNAKWHDIKRDLAIYQEKKKGKYLKEIGENFGIDFTTVSVIVKKVQGAINYWKGKLFEDFIEKRLRESGLFKKVIKEAGKGEADILAYAKDGKTLYIYSVKNIKIDRKPYFLTTEELRPELKRALLQTLDYKIYLVLLVFDNHNDKAKQFEIDYNNPTNIDISK